MFLGFISLIGCHAIQDEGKLINLTEKDHNRWVFATKKSLIYIRLRIYEDRPLRWKLVYPWKDVSETIEKPENWIPGDHSFQVFWFKAGDGSRKVEIKSSEERKLTFHIGVLRR